MKFFGKRTTSAGMMDRILVCLGIFLLAFIITMIVVFVYIGSTPDTLITCVFAICGGECGILGWIKTNKEKLRDRKWYKEDQKEAERMQHLPGVDSQNHE